MAGEHYPTPGQTTPPGPGSFLNYPAVPDIAQWLASQGLISSGAMAPPKSGGFGFSASFGGPGGGPSAGASQPGAVNSPYGPYSGGYQYPGSSAANFGNVISGGSTTAPVGSSSPGWMQTLGNWMGNSNLGWGDLAKGALGAGLSYWQANEANKYAGPQQYGSTSSSSPWGPSADYRTAGMDLAFQQLLSAMGGQQAGGGGGGGGGGGKPFQFNSQGLIDQLANRAGQGHPLYGASTDYASWLMSGQQQNPYSDQIMQQLSGGFGNPNLDAFIQSMMGGQMGGGGSGSGGVMMAGGGGGPVATGREIGIEDYIQNILGGQYLEGNPFLDDQISGLERDATQAFERSILPALNDQFEGAGRYGGSQRALSAGRAGADLAGDLSGEIADMRSADYSARMADLMTALGLGTSWDQHQGDLGLGYAGIASQDRATQGAMSSAAGAQNTQMQIAQLGALMDAFGMQTGLQQFGMQGQLGLADLFSTDQRFALGMTPELTGMDIRDWRAAIDPSLQLDSMRYGAFSDQQNRAQANARYGQQLPWQNLSQFANLINAFGGAFGEQTTTGTQPGPPPTSPWMQGLAGFFGGVNSGRPA